METVGWDFSSKQFGWGRGERQGDKGGSLRIREILFVMRATWDAGMWRGKNMGAVGITPGCLFIWAGREVGVCPPALRRSSWTLRKSAPTLSIYLPFITWRNSSPKSEVSCPWSQSKSMTPDLLVPGPFLSCCRCQWEKQPWHSLCFQAPNPPDWLFPAPSECTSLQILVCQQGFSCVWGGRGGWVRELLCHFLNKPEGNVLSCKSVINRTV